MLRLRAILGICLLIAAFLKFGAVHGWNEGSYFEQQVLRSLSMILLTLTLIFVWPAFDEILKERPPIS